MKSSKFKKIIFAINLLLIFFVVFLSFDKKIKTQAQNEIENPAGWSWNNIFGWNNGNCNTVYYGVQQDYCRITTSPILDINFDSNLINFTNGTITDDLRSAVVGNITGLLSSDIVNRTGSSNLNSAISFVPGETNTKKYINFGNKREFNFNDPGQEFSISLWFYPTKKETGYLFSSGPITSSDSNDKGYFCYIYDNGSSGLELICSIRGMDSTVVLSNNVSLNDWHNLTLTYKAKTLSLYFDYVYSSKSENEMGILSYSLPSSTRFTGEHTYDLILGGEKLSSASNSFRGYIDEFRFFNEELSKQEVSHNMFHNSRYSVNVNNNTGNIDGWMWSNGLGWICFGTTCGSLNTPRGSLSDTKINWSGNQSARIYPHMVTGWAKIYNFDSNNGWISLQGRSTSVPVNNYTNCVSCVTRDGEPSLVGYWKLDENIGDVVNDSSGKSHSGTLSNFRENSWLDNNCKAGSCLDFPFYTSVITIDSPEQIGKSNFSIEAWVKTSGVEDKGYIFQTSNITGGSDDGQNVSLYYNNSTPKSIVLDFLGENISADISSSPITNNSWHQIIISVDRDGMANIYLDTNKIVSGLVSDHVSTYINNNKLFLGNNGVDKAWLGQMDIVRVYKKTLSQEEIDYNFDYPEKRFCSGCFNELEPNSKPDNNICYECDKCKLVESTNKCASCSTCNKYGIIFDTNTASFKGYAWAGDKVGWINLAPNLGSGIYRSYVSAKYGNIYSKSNIGSDYSVTPPTGFYNSSYLIQANGHLINWSTEQAVLFGNYGSQPTILGPDFNPSKPWLNYYGNPRGYTAPNYDYPKSTNDYGNILGSIDLDSLHEIAMINSNIKLPGDTSSVNPNTCLGNKVYYVSGNTTINSRTGLTDAYVFQNCSSAAGTIIIDGDLTINGDISYETSSFSGFTKNLASVAWIIKGDLKISGNVKKLAGTFVVLGQDNADCGTNIQHPNQKCGTIYTAYDNNTVNQLQISGQVLAKNFQFQRTYKDAAKNPAELIIYDGRNLVNTPPGLGDVAKSLPRWDQIAPY